MFYDPAKISIILRPVDSLSQNKNLTPYAICSRNISRTTADPVTPECFDRHFSTSCVPLIPRCSIRTISVIRDAYALRTSRMNRA